MFPLLSASRKMLFGGSKCDCNYFGMYTTPAFWSILGEMKLKNLGTTSNRHLDFVLKLFSPKKRTQLLSILSSRRDLSIGTAWSIGLAGPRASRDSPSQPPISSEEPPYWSCLHVSVWLLCGCPEFSIWSGQPRHEPFPGWAVSETLILPFHDRSFCKTNVSLTAYFMFFWEFLLPGLLFRKVFLLHKHRGNAFGVRDATGGRSHMMWDVRVGKRR